MVKSSLGSTSRLHFDGMKPFRPRIEFKILIVPNFTIILLVSGRIGAEGGFILNYKVSYFSANW